MLVASIAAFVTSVFTGLSVLLAVLAFKRNEDRTTFTRFRLALVDIRHTVEELDRTLAEPLFSELSENIANELKALFPKDVSKEEVLRFMSDSDNHDYIVHAIHVGRLKSQRLGEINGYVSSLRRAPFEFKDTLPAVSTVCLGVIPYITRVTQVLTSAEMAHGIFADPELFEEMVVPETDGIEDVNTVYAEFACALSGTCSIVLIDDGQSVIDAAVELLSLLTDEVVPVRWTVRGRK